MLIVERVRWVRDTDDGCGEEAGREEEVPDNEILGDSEPPDDRRSREVWEKQGCAWGWLGAWLDVQGDK